MQGKELTSNELGNTPMALNLLCSGKSTLKVVIQATLEARVNPEDLCALSFKLHHMNSACTSGEGSPKVFLSLGMGYGRRCQQRANLLASASWLKLRIHLERPACFRGLSSKSAMELESSGSSTLAAGIFNFSMDPSPSATPQLKPLSDPSRAMTSLRACVDG